MAWASVPPPPLAMPPPPSAAGGPAAAPGWGAWLAPWLSPNAVSNFGTLPTEPVCAEEPAFPGLAVILDVPGLAAAAVVRGN